MVSLARRKPYHTEAVRRSDTASSNCESLQSDDDELTRTQAISESLRRLPMRFLLHPLQNFRLKYLKCPLLLLPPRIEACQRDRQTLLRI